MKREEVIRIVTCRIPFANLVSAVNAEAENGPRNYTLQLLNKTISTGRDTHENWFTALAVLCLYQKTLAGRILQAAAQMNGGPALSQATVADLKKAISDSSKMSKADAG